MEYNRKNKRKPERVREIDAYIREHYPTNGPDVVAKDLGEDRKYIIQRANYKRVCMIRQIHKKPKHRITSKDRIKQLTIWNKELRVEVIRLRHQVMNQKKEK